MQKTDFEKQILMSFDPTYSIKKLFDPHTVLQKCGHPKGEIKP